jgi:hypothetical protein
MQDDIYCLMPGGIPSVHAGHLNSVLCGRESYASKLLWQTRDWMKAEGITGRLNYEMHCPVLLETDKVRDVLERTGTGKPLLFRTIYGNMHRIGGRKVEDWKARHWPGTWRRRFLSSCPAVERDLAFREWLRARLPEPSRWERREKDAPESRPAP